MENAQNDILDRLDQILATLRLAFEPQISEARAGIRQDPVNAAILDATKDWVSTTDLQGKVAQKTGTSHRTVRNRLAELVARGILASRGGGHPEYKGTGLV